MLELLNQGIKDKKMVNTTALSHFDDVFELLKVTEKLRDIRQETEESKKLQSILEKLSATFFITPREEEVEEHKAQDLEEQVEKIDYTDEKNLASVFHDLLIETLPKIENYTKGLANIDRIVAIIEKLRNGCKILGFDFRKHGFR